MLEGQSFEPNGRLAQFMRLVDALDRSDIEAGVDLLIEALDRSDGDPDLEDSEASDPYVDKQGRSLLARTIDKVLPGDDADAADIAWQEWDARTSQQRKSWTNEPIGSPLGSEDDELCGDERDGDFSEDEFMDYHSHGPGCPVADAGEMAGDEGDTGWSEWHARGRDKIDRWGAEILGRERSGYLTIDDDEDGDADAEHDGREPDPDAEPDDYEKEDDGVEARAKYRRRTQRTRCERRVYEDPVTNQRYVSYHLMQRPPAGMTG